MNARAYSGFAACSGCSLCLLPCPVWHATRDIRLTPHGRAKALQHGATASDLEKSIDSCTLCGACEPACPEDIELVDMVVGLRRELNRASPARSAQVDAQLRLRAERPAVKGSAAVQIIPDRALATDAVLLAKIVQLFGVGAGVALAADDGSDIALALEAGAEISATRRSNFLASLRSAKTLIVGDGLLLRALRGWLPRTSIESLGEAISSLAAVRKNLRNDDLYVIEPRAYHADRERLVKYYDALRISHGCAMNLDLQRLAIPTTAGSLPGLAGKSVIDLQEQTRWILEGREFSRIVVEDASDLAAFRAATDKAVMHIVELADLK